MNARNVAAFTGGRILLPPEMIDRQAGRKHARQPGDADPHPVNVQSFLVRHAPGRHNAGRLVGIFCAASIGDLAAIVDEWFSPDALEAAVLPAGGLYWPHEPDFPVPNRLTPDAAEQHAGLPDMPRLTTLWDAFVYGLHTIECWMALPVQGDCENS